MGEHHEEACAWGRELESGLGRGGGCEAAEVRSKVGYSVPAVGIPEKGVTA